ncbi:GNAT family N-acetyltransferase [Streptomyces megasporus]|uniref:GNAT family N-acetyltransferase n=1 Tax=Streptomyces megasporus TaxID=44060 RepID=UPI000998DF5F|nr:GNAT family N-acetyltransferase [Streptomyces megasporus]
MTEVRTTSTSENTGNAGNTRTVQTLHTADLDTATREAVRKLLDEAFEGDFGDQDWEHCLGGVHALVWEESELVGHGSLVQRRLLHGGRALRAGYLEGVGVRSDRRGLGHGKAVLEALERVIRGAYEVGALSSAEDALDFYASRGWQRWQGPTAVLTPTGVVRTEGDDGGVFVLPVTARLDPTRVLVCDWRDGDVW